MSCYKETIIDYAKSQVGTRETGTNINKYAAEIDKSYPDFYNGKKQGAEWCDIFVDYCFIHCFGEENALRLTCQPKKSTGAGCKFSYGFYKAKKQTGKEPRLGAQVFFGSSESKINHTGLVVEVTADKVITIEGNKNNAVTRCEYSKTSKTIYGYGYPAYDEAPAQEPLNNNSEEKTVNIEMPVLEQGAKGEAVRTLQILLNSKFGERLDCDGKFGKLTYNSVVKYQRNHQPPLTPIDGCVGAGTWAALLK